jgi:hypothetical protein
MSEVESVGETTVPTSPLVGKPLLQKVKELSLLSKRETAMQGETTVPTSPLTGKALLQKVRELSHLAKRETAKQCGYVKTTSSGGVRTDLAGFYDAVLTAKGVKLDETSRDNRGEAVTYKAKVNKDGQLAIGAGYTRQMGLQEGAVFEIRLGYKHIHLVQIDLDESEVVNQIGESEERSLNLYQEATDNSPKILQPTNNDIKKILLLASGKPLTISAVSHKISASEERVELLRKNRELIGIPVEGYGYLYPAFQFKEDGSILPGFDKLLQALDRFDVWMQLQFLQTGDLRLDGATPIDALKQGKLEQALFAAENYAGMRAA